MKVVTTRMRTSGHALQNAARMGGKNNSEDILKNSQTAKRLAHVLKWETLKYGNVFVTVTAAMTKLQTLFRIALSRVAFLQKNLSPLLERIPPTKESRSRGYQLLPPALPSSS